MATEADPRERAVAREIADKVIAFLNEHDRDAHDGEICDDARVEIVAFICHSIGVHRGMAAEFLIRVGEEIVEYDLEHRRRHGDHAHHHGPRNGH